MNPNFDHKVLASIFQIIAEKYPNDSEEYKAIEIASRATLFIFMTGQTNSFQKFWEELNAPLTSEEKKRLSDHGIQHIS